MREIIATSVAEDPDKYSEAILGRTNHRYSHGARDTIFRSLGSRVDTKEAFFTFAKYEINTKVNINFAKFREILYNSFREIFQNFAESCKKISRNFAKLYIDTYQKSSKLE
jgi:hypothetical protein